MSQGSFYDLHSNINRKRVNYGEYDIYQHGFYQILVKILKEFFDDMQHTLVTTEQRT